MNKTITLFEDSIGIGATIDVSDPDNIGLEFWYEEQTKKGKRNMILEGWDYFDENFFRPLRAQMEASQFPTRELPEIVQKFLAEETNGYLFFDVDDNFIDTFWLLMQEISMTCNPNYSYWKGEDFSITEELQRNAGNGFVKEKEQVAA